MGTLYRTYILKEDLGLTCVLWDLYVLTRQLNSQKTCKNHFSQNKV